MTRKTEPVARRVKLSCRNIWKLYGARGDKPAADLDEMESRHNSGQYFTALKDINLDVAEGEIFVVMGLSGSGKSTLLRCLAQLVQPTFGTVELDGRSLTDMDAASLREVRRHDIGMVFQHFGLLPHLTVAGNVALPLKIRGDSLIRQEEATRTALELTGLATMADRLPAQLSGGQQQRVGLARALAVGPGLLFLDEPFSALDPLIRRELQDELIRLQASLHKTMIFVTHDFSEAVRIGDRIAIMKDGCLRQVGSPEEIVSKPADDYVRSFVTGVDMTRVIRCGTASVPATKNDYAQTVGTRQLLSDAAFILSENGGQTIGVVNAAGELIGEIGVEAILKAVSANSAERVTA